MLKLVDDILGDLGDLVSGFDLKYNKFYIGIAKDGAAKNYISFKPKKQFIYLCIKGREDSNTTDRLDEAGIDYAYESRYKQYRIKIKSFSEYEKNRDLITDLVSTAKEHYDL